MERSGEVSLERSEVEGVWCFREVEKRDRRLEVRGCRIEINGNVRIFLMVSH